MTTQTERELASVAVNAANALVDEKRHYEIACAEITRLKARIAELEVALTATGRSLSSFIFDSTDPGTDALGAQWLYHQVMPQADDPFAQPRAFRASVFEEAAKAVEGLNRTTDGDRQKRTQAYLDGFEDGVDEAAEHLNLLADKAAQGGDPR